LRRRGTPFNVNLSSTFLFNNFFSCVPRRIKSPLPLPLSPQYRSLRAWRKTFLVLNRSLFDPIPISAHNVTSTGLLSLEMVYSSQTPRYFNWDDVSDAKDLRYLFGHVFTETITPGTRSVLAPILRRHNVIPPLYSRSLDVPHTDEFSQFHGFREPTWKV